MKKRRHQIVSLLLEEESVAELHDIGLVDASHLLALVARRVVEGELGDAARLLGRYHLDGFNMLN